MPFHLGTSELIIILVIVIILFGVGRIGRLGQDFGRAISEFRRATREQDESPDLEKHEKSENAQS